MRLQLIPIVSFAVALFAQPALADRSRDCAPLQVKSGQSSVLETRIAGIPAILSIPKVVTKPPIILWHGYGPPASKEALMQALPLDQVPAVKVYVDLPLFGERTPPGGVDDLIRRQTEDFASLLFEPSVMGAADELPSIVNGLQRDGCMLGSDKIGVFGFSAGGTATLIALMHARVAIGAAVTINASTGLQESVEAYEHAAKRQYVWTAAARKLASDTDAVAHAGDIARSDPLPALMIIQGKDDTTLNPARADAFYDALSPYYKQTGSTARLDLKMIPRMSHDWTAANEASHIRDLVAAWFDRFLR